MVVRVAIDLALGRLFDYAVPDALEKKLAVGQLLSVPFGHREARGFAMELVAGNGAPGDAGRRLRPVTAIVDETPFFSAALLEVVKKVSAYIAAPIETVLRAALPAVVMKRNARAKEMLFVEPLATDHQPLATDPSVTAVHHTSISLVPRLRKSSGNRSSRRQGKPLRLPCTSLRPSPEKTRRHPRRQARASRTAF